ncbi:MAG: class I SAM-dependent methyltransferase [Candidatus Dormibacteria bacterium]
MWWTLPRRARMMGRSGAPTALHEHPAWEVKTLAEAVDWDQRFLEEPWPSHPDPDLVQLAEGLAPGRALDFGCGPGRNSIWLARRGWRVTGLDSSEVGLSQARERAQRQGVRLDLVLGDMETWPVPEGQFDLVVLDNIHPAPDRRPGLFARAASAVAPRGHLFIVGHDLANLGVAGPSDGDRLFTVERLRQDLAELDLDRLERVARRRDDGKSDMAVVVWARPQVPDR